MKEWIPAGASIVAALISGLFTYIASKASASSNASAERAKALSDTVAQLETEARNLLEGWHERLKPLSRNPNVSDSEDIYYEGEYRNTHVFIATGHITGLIDDILDEYPIYGSVAKIRSLVGDVKFALGEIDSEENPDNVSEENIEALRRALAQLKQQIKSDLDSEKERLKAK
jgi:hypothetical protein